MARCDVCGNDDPRTFTVTRADQKGTFDSFECAIQMMAPACEHCGCRLLGHGVETDEGIYCCEHCAREAGAQHRERSHANTDLVAPAGPPSESRQE
ncbi:hypothetical protein BMF89_03915 [Arthrobacter sp. SRS-W-1-2016]|jgi:hypothetical protein|nr:MULTISPECIES: hypothetical protein [Arthrobacter]MDQ0211539.1 hypothetical protein [Arthrobacter bambusae]MDQ0235709.1 hypothetical protein [Arthrobacter bambusae]OOP64326.1 hypothetical protein BMF89_03915 [Arthrobacter sp. SRS-W-1-2016]